MKNIKTLLIVSLCMASASALAAGKAPAKYQRQYGMAGCGLGSQVMGRSGSQVLASTTNYTAYNQAFGITSGTSNCLDGPAEEVAQKMDRFIQVNKAVLANDMARGNGEALSALAKIAGCTDTTRFSSTLQSKFGEIYPNEKVKFMDVTDSVIDVIQKDSELSKSCEALIVG